MKFYRVNITRWTKDRGEYREEVLTPETLNTYSLYGHDETHAAPLVLFAIGGNQADGYADNWDIYADKKGTLYSIPRTGSGCRGTYFGDVNHIRHLMRQGHFSDTLTEYGLFMMKGGTAA